MLCSATKAAELTTILQAKQLLQQHSLGTQPVVELASKWQPYLHTLAQSAVAVALNFQHVL
jgi:hypothetical protein